MQHIDIYLHASEQRQYDGYGLVFTSDTRHLIAGRKGGFSDRTPFLVQVYENRTSWMNGEPTGIIVDAYNNPTDEPYSYILQGQSVMIASSPVETEPWGETLDESVYVSLRIGNYSLGVFRLQTRNDGQLHLIKHDFARTV